MMQRIVFAVFMSLLLSSLMTAWVTWINLGWSDGFYGHWLTAFLSSWPAAAIISFCCAPEVHRFSCYVTRNIKGVNRRL
ncbi:MAG: DUF2798 domain-containing protein [Bermanella sp.]